MEYRSKDNKVTMSYLEWTCIGEMFKLIESRNRKAHNFKTASINQGENETYSLIKVGNGYLLRGKRNGEVVYGHYILASFQPYPITHEELRRRLEQLGFNIESTKGGSLNSDFKVTRLNTLPITVSTGGDDRWINKHGYKVAFRNFRRVLGEDLAEVLFSRRFRLGKLIEQGFNLESLRFESVLPKDDSLQVEPLTIKFNNLNNYLDRGRYSILDNGQWKGIEAYDLLDKLILTDEGGLIAFNDWEDLVQVMLTSEISQVSQVSQVPA